MRWNLLLIYQINLPMTQVASSPQAIDSEQADTVLELCALKKLSATKFLTYIALKLI